MGSIVITLPETELLDEFNKSIQVLFDQIKIRTEQMEYSAELLSILLSKMATIENELELTT